MSSYVKSLLYALAENFVKFFFLIWQHITAILWKWATVLEGIMADFHNMPTQMPLENLQDILADGSKQRGKAMESKDGARQHPAAVAVAVALDWICASNGEGRDPHLGTRNTRFTAVKHVK